MQQYFSDKKNGNILYLKNEDFNHIKNVMRMKENNKIIVVFKEISYICNLNKDLQSATIESTFKENVNNEAFILYMPLLQEEKMKYVIQKGTELGVTEFVIVAYERCKFKLPEKDYEKKLVRWNKIAKEASEQCYRINKPIIEKIIKPGEIASNENVKLVCSLVNEDVKHISEVLNHKNANDTIGISFGPEGGFSANEENNLIEKGFIRTSLGSNVLRTETVPLYVASVLSYLKGSAK